MTIRNIRNLKTIPLQIKWHHCNSHRIPDRLMYDTGATMGENRSDQQKVTATTQTKVLTCQQEIALRNESPHLHQSKRIAAIRIKFRID